jgi:hypothetical protein
MRIYRSQILRSYINGGWVVFLKEFNSTGVTACGTPHILYRGYDARIHGIVGVISIWTGIIGSDILILFGPDQKF